MTHVTIDSPRKHGRSTVTPGNFGNRKQTCDAIIHNNFFGQGGERSITDSIEESEEQPPP